MPKIFPFLICFLFFVSSSIVTIACTCSGEQSFCEKLNQSPNLSDHPTHVFKAIKVKDTLHGMIVQPLKNYMDVVELEPMVIWGDPGHLCRPYTSNFEIGGTYILAVNRFFIPQYDFEQQNDFVISICGTTYLSVEDNMVLGAITPSFSSMPLEDFEFYMESEAYLENCSISNSADDILNSIPPSLFPNPTSETFRILAEDPDFAFDEIRIFNSQGQLILLENFLLPTAHAQYDTGTWAKGVYFVQLRRKDAEFGMRLLVE